jgi:hypothetical protein
LRATSQADALLSLLAEVTSLARVGAGNMRSRSTEIMSILLGHPQLFDIFQLAPLVEHMIASDHAPAWVADDDGDSDPAPYEMMRSFELLKNYLPMLNHAPTATEPKHVASWCVLRGFGSRGRFGSAV